MSSTSRNDWRPAWSAFFAGIQAELPILIGVSPFGMIYGVLAINAGLNPVPAQGMSSIVFAGSAQFVTTQLLATQSPGWVIVFTIAVMNLRHALYSASIAPYLARLREGWKWLLAYFLTDEAYAVTILHLQKKEEEKYPHYYLLGAGLALWVCWQASTALGILLGAIIPESWSLDFTLALTFIALLVPALKRRPEILAAGVSGIVAVLTWAFPYKLGLLIAAVSGIGIGLWAEGRK